MLAGSTRLSGFFFSQYYPAIKINQEITICF